MTPAIRFLSKIGFLCLLAGIALSFLLPSSFALTNTVSSLELTYDNDPIFAETNLVPSSSIIKTFTVKNVGGSQVTVGISGTETSDPGNLSDKITLVISSDGSDLYGVGGTKTLSNFYSDGEIQLATLDPNQSKTFTMTTTLDSTLGNEYQNQKVMFDLTIGSLGQSTTNPGSSTSSSSSSNSTSNPSVLGQTTGEVLGISTLPATGLPIYVLLGLISLLFLGFLLRRASSKSSS